MKRIIWMAIAIMSLTAGLAWAGSEERLGTGGALELQLPVGARSIALGGANLGNVAGVEGLFYNPAGLAGMEGPTEVTFNYSRHIADMDVNYFAVGQRVGGFGHVGVSVKVLSVGDIPFTSETAPDGNGEMFSPTFSTLGLTYARQITDRVNFGGTVYYVSERILQETASGVAFDFGFQYDTGYRGLRLGMTMKNFGPSMEFTGSDFERNIFYPDGDPQSGSRTVRATSSNFELPSSFQLGLSYPLLAQGGHRFGFHGLYRSNSFSLDEGRVGAEWTYQNYASLRVGYRYNSADNDLFGLAYGGGLRVPLGASHLWVDYARQEVSNFFDDIQHVAVSVQF